MTASFSRLKTKNVLGGAIKLLRTHRSQARLELGIGYSQSCGANSTLKPVKVGSSTIWQLKRDVPSR